MPNIFKPKRSTTASSVPTTGNLSDGELAVNLTDRKIFVRNGASIVTVASDLVDGDKGDITVSSSGATWTIDSGVVTNAKLANVSTATIKGRTTAGTGSPEDLTGTQATALLDTFTTSLKGLAPASGGGTANFLRADGTWAAPVVSGNLNVGIVTATSFVRSGGTSSQFLKADGSVDSNTYLTSASTLTAGNLSGTIPSAVLGNSSVFLGTTSVALNRGTGALSLAGVSVDGSSGSCTGNSNTATTLATTRTIWGQNFNGSGNVTGSLTGVIDISASGITTASSFVRSGGTSSQFLKADGSVDSNTYITSASVGNGTLSLGVSGTGLSGTASFTANQSGNTTFTITSNATSANTANTIVSRDASGNFIAGIITATTFSGALSGNATSATTATSATSATSAGSVTNSVTFNNAGTGAASGTTFNGSSAVTISHNTIGASPLAGSTSLTTTGTVTTGTWSGSFGAVSGANLTSLTAGNLSGTIPSAVLGNSAHFIGTTSIALNRASASQSLTGVSIDGSSGSCTGNSATATTLATIRTIWGQNFDGSANVTGALTGATDITASGTVKGNQVIGGTGTAIGSAGLIVNGTTGDNDSQLIIKKPSQSSFGVLSWDGQVFLSANIYYDNGVWVHSAPSLNTNNNMLVLAPGTGVQWYASNNSTGSWNVAGGTTLWNDSGVWQRSLSNTLTLNTSGTGLSGSTTYNNSGAVTFTVTSNATPANTALTIVSRDSSGNFIAGIITATTFSGALSGNATSATTATSATSAGSVTNSVTFNNGGAGAASGTTFNGSSAVTISHNTIGASPLAGSASLTTTGTVTSGTWSASFGSVSGANLTNLTAGNLSGTIPSGVLGNSSLFVGTTSIALNRASASQSLTGVSIDGSSGSCTGNAATATTLQTSRTIWGQSFNGSGNVTGSLTGVIDISASGITTASSFVRSGGTSSQFLKADGSVDSNTYITSASVGNGTLTLAVSGTGLSGSQSFTANQSGNATFTVTSNATPANTALTIVSRDSSGNFIAGIITATTFSGALSGNATSATTATSAGSVTNSLTFNNGGAGAASGTTFNGSSAQTISHNTIGASPLAGSTSLTTTGTVTTGTWSASFGAVSGANLTSLTAGNLSGTIPSGVLGNSSLFVGTTSIALNRASASQSLTGVNIDGSSGSCTGNAATATTFSTNRTNYSGVTNGAVSGQLMWKNYGNNHTIFDASNSTDPNGGAVNNTNAAVAWSATYPTLMGWNGTSTYGVRVDSARISDTATILATARNIGGTSFNGSADITPFRANTIAVIDAGTLMQSSATYAARTASSTPQQYTYGVNWEFKNASTVGGAGNYAGLLTLAPWQGTTASTGDPNYQLAFSPAAANSTAIPTLQMRAGIDTTWGSWATILHSSSTLTAGNLSGTIPSAVLGNSSHFIGTTSIALNRGSGAQTLTGVSIDGNAATATSATSATSAGSVTNSVTFNNAGTGAASGTTFNGSAAQTISYNTIGASPLAGSTSLTTTGTVTTGTWSGSFGSVSGANLTNLTAGNLSGTIPSGVLGNSSLFVGTTSIALNRASAAQALTGITSIDGSAATLTTTRTIWGQNFNGSANVTGALTGVTDITATGNVAVDGAFRAESSNSTERFEIYYNETTDSLDFDYLTV